MHSTVLKPASFQTPNSSASANRTHTPRLARAQGAGEVIAPDIRRRCATSRTVLAVERGDHDLRSAEEAIALVDVEDVSAFDALRLAVLPLAIAAGVEDGLPILPWVAVGVEICAVAISKGHVVEPVGFALGVWLVDVVDFERVGGCKAEKAKGQSHDGDASEHGVGGVYLNEVEVNGSLA